MSNGLTTAGKTRINQLKGLEQPLVIDRIILANITGLDYTQPIDPSLQMPDAGDIVLDHSISYKGYVSPDQVVYSLVIGSDIGNFSFNWLGLIEQTTNTVIAVAYYPVTQKWQTDLQTNTTGNLLTRNITMSFQDVQALTGITIAAEWWQFEYQTLISDTIASHASLELDPTDTNTVKQRHLSNAQAKLWQDHIGNVALHTAFAAGVSMVFYNASAPIGWTRSTDHNDKALRVVSGVGGGSGGSHNLSSPPSPDHSHGFSGGSTASSNDGGHTHGHTLGAAAHTLTIGEMPAHVHYFDFRSGPVGDSVFSPVPAVGTELAIDGRQTKSTGGGGSHTHGISGSINSAAGHTHTITAAGTVNSGGPAAFAPKYVDVIVCIKG